VSSTCRGAEIFVFFPIYCAAGVFSDFIGVFSLANFGIFAATTGHERRNAAGVNARRIGHGIFDFFPIDRAAVVLGDFAGVFSLTIFRIFHGCLPWLSGGKDRQRFERLHWVQIALDPLRQRGLQRIKRFWCIT
jgi:hypothetical protein